MKAIEIENLYKYYGNSRGVVGVDLSVDEGDFFGFIGPNGAGKSTTIRILLGLINPTNGKVKIFDKDIKTHKTELLSDIGYLPSEALFYPNMKVSEIIKLSAKLHNKNCDVEAKNLCDRLNLDTSKRINELSLGNRKKVGIVCALQHKPKLYILDEPTSGLDPLIQKELYQLLLERNKEGATIFLSSHILNEVEKYCSHTAIIKDGKIIINDSVKKLSYSGVKRVILRGEVQIPKLDNIKNVIINDSSLEFLYTGNINELIKSISHQNITDISITEPDLEEVFMHFYNKETK